MIARFIFENEILFELLKVRLPCETNPQIETHSIERAKIKMLCGNSLDFIFQNKIMDVSLLGIISKSFVFSKSNLEKIKQKDMTPV